MEVLSREQISENCGNRGGKIGSRLDGSQAASILVGHDNSSAMTIAADLFHHNLLGNACVPGETVKS